VRRFLVGYLCILEPPIFCNTRIMIPWLIELGLGNPSKGDEKRGSGEIGT